MKKNLRIATLATLLTIAGASTAFAGTATDSNATPITMEENKNTEESKTESYETKSETKSDIEVGGLKDSSLGDLAALLGGFGSNVSDTDMDLVEDTEEFNGNVEFVEIPEIETPEIEVPEIETPEVEKTPEVETPEIEEPVEEVPETETPVVEETPVEEDAPVEETPVVEETPIVEETTEIENEEDDEEESPVVVLVGEVSEEEPVEAETETVEVFEEEEIARPEYENYALPTLPKTGDNSGMALATCIASFMGLCAISLKEKKFF